MPDHPRTFIVKAEYTVTVEALAISDEAVRARIERRAHELLFDLRQRDGIEVNVINTSLVVEPQP